MFIKKKKNEVLGSIRWTIHIGTDNAPHPDTLAIRHTHTNSKPD